MQQSKAREYGSRVSRMPLDDEGVEREGNDRQNKTGM